MLFVILTARLLFQAGVTGRFPKSSTYCGISSEKNESSKPFYFQRELVFDTKEQTINDNFKQLTMAFVFADIVDIMQKHEGVL